MIPEDLATLARNIFVLIRASVVSDGAALQEAVTELARRVRGVTASQGPRHLTFFGLGSASGLPHELDGGIQGQNWVAMVECKAVAGGPSKSDVLVFDGKTFDVYVRALSARRRGPHYRFLVSSSAVREQITTYCAQRGIICICPDLVPLPVLLDVLCRPIADDLFTDVELQEADRLFTQACLPMERIWQRRGDELCIRLQRFGASESADLRYLHEQMSRRVLEYLGSNAPGWTTVRAARLALRSTGAHVLTRSA